MKSLLRRAATWAHKWLALLVGLQVLAWVLGGVVFALVPFDAWVKSGDTVRKPAQVKADTPIFPLADIAARHAPLRSIELVGQAKGFNYRLTDPAGKKIWLDAATGTVVPPPDANRIGQLAREWYRGEAALASVRRIDVVETRAFGLVDELHGKVPAWQANFADGLNTRLYFTTDTGEFLRARNDAWVLYDFFWRLHIMDYGNGENFNNIFLRLLAPLALVLVLSGAVLLCFTQFRKKTSNRLKT